MAEVSSKSLTDHFSALEDPRQAWKVVYPLPEILLLVLCGTLAGANNFVEIEEWGLDRQEFLRRFLPYEKGVASHDTLNDVMNALDGAVFSACFTTWVEALRDGEPDIVAMGCQTKIAQAILDKEADYLLAIKENWPSLHGEIERCFNDALDGDLDRFETTDGDHGRIEIRRHAVSRDGCPCPQNAQS